MKKNSFIILASACMALSFAACNSSGDTSSSTTTGDSGTMANNNTTPNPTDNTANSSTSSGEYGAWADTVESNSRSGYYLNAKTGKPYKSLTVDRTTGEIKDENNEPVWRYVDNRNWWVYGLDDADWEWGTMGEAKMDKEQLMYKGEKDKWVSYDDEWKMSDEKISKGWKDKTNGVKIKVSKDGDIKIKDKNGTTKYDADDDKIKTDKSHN